jgi:hypothetical protein
MLIFSNLNNLCPFVTTTLNINSVNSSITGLLGSSVNWIKILYFWLIQFWIASPDRWASEKYALLLEIMSTNKRLRRYLPQHHNTRGYLTAACNKIKL